MRETIEQKAARYLAEGRLRIVRLTGDSVEAECRGEETYTVQLISGDWRCSCPARTPRCTHVRAVEAVTVPSHPAS